MHDYSKFPPIQFLILVLRTQPKAALLFVELWQKVVEDSKIIKIRKNNISSDYTLSPTLFKNTLMSLRFIEVLDFEDIGKFYNIELKRGRGRQHNRSVRRVHFKT
jgi:hypothetical protein